MSYKFYQFGIAVGGFPESIGFSNYGPPQVASGTLGAATLTINFTSMTKWILIRNTHDADYMQYSVDEGTTWSTLGPYGETSAPLAIDSLRLRRVSGAPTYYVEAALS